jgi:hypothetical protein
MFFAPQGQEFSPMVSTWLKPLVFYANRRTGKYLESIAYGSNEYRLEAYAIFTPSRRRGGSGVMVLSHDLKHRSTLRRAV